MRLSEMSDGELLDNFVTVILNRVDPRVPSGGSRTEFGYLWDEIAERMGSLREYQRAEKAFRGRLEGVK